MNATLKCDNCGRDLRAAYDSWDDDPRLPRVMRFYPCECIMRRLEKTLEVVDTCHGFIDRSGGNDISVKDWIGAKIAQIKKLNARVADLTIEIDQQNDMLGGLH